MFLRIPQLSRIPARPRVAQAKPKLPAIPSLSTSAPATAYSRHFSHLSRTSPAAEIANKLEKDGCVVIESMLTPSQISGLNRDLDAALANVPAGRPANANTAPLPEGADGAVFGHNTKRLGDLLNASGTFREEVIDNDSLHDVSSEIFEETGDYWLSTAQMIQIGPGSKAQPLHPDASGWWPFWSMGDKWTPEFAVNFLIATTDTTKMNGATGVVRGSNKIKYSEVMDDTTFGFWRFSDEEVEQIELKAGDCLLLGGRIVHRGEANKTADEFRRILSCTVISSTLTPEEAHPLLLNEDMVKKVSERAKKFLGFRELATTIGPDVWQDHRQGGLMRRLGF
ncbi:hypothetical protein B0J13DRAFT_559596 [Dactylonectria estremocensis]|uniref:Phytanoyl-CoA dioxygenase n=1 Tax=Dactylonectria estremocensis TaxID=1079267 RepID=A0A9P9EDG6_9HYPO|nr:hypothetical protein B0J13DRAFT_559596 [Dactylonectria estremocensis]